MPDGSRITHFDRNPLLVLSEPTLADVLERLASDVQLEPTRRRDLCSAVRRLARLLDRDPAMLPARMSDLNEAIKRVNPAQCGVSEKSLQNIRSDALAALRHLGINQSYNTVRGHLSKEWRQLAERLPSKRLSNGLSRFIRYCSAGGIRPGEVDDSVVDGFVFALREGTFVRNVKGVHRRTTHLWNEAAATIEGWPQRVLSEPDNRLPCRSLALPAFPASFQADVRSYLNWLTDPDPFAEHRPPRPNRPTSVELKRRQIELAASALVERGQSTETITVLADLVQIDAVKEILRHYVDKKGRDNQFTRDLAKCLISVARHWVQLDEAQLRTLNDLKRRLGPDRAGLTAKNQDALRQFEDLGNVRRLLELPATLFAEACRRDELASQLVV
jgi:hypothetical protein